MISTLIIDEKGLSFRKYQLLSYDELNLLVTVFTRLSDVVLFKFFAFQLGHLFGGSPYFWVALFRILLSYAAINQGRCLNE